MGTFAAASHESRVYNDAREPGGKRRPALKGSQAGVCLAHAVLQRILRIFLVVQHSECGVVEPACMRGEETLLGISVPSDGLLDEVQISVDVAQSDSSVRIQLP